MATGRSRLAWMTWTSRALDQTSGNRARLGVSGRVVGPPEPVLILWLTGIVRGPARHAVVNKGVALPLVDFGMAIRKREAGGVGVQRAAPIDERRLGRYDGHAGIVDRTR